MGPQLNDCGRLTDLYDGPEEEHGGDGGGRRPPLEVDRDEGGDEADDGGVARRERLARVSLVLRRALQAGIDYLITSTNVGKNLDDF